MQISAYYCKHLHLLCELGYTPAFISGKQSNLANDKGGQPDLGTSIAVLLDLCKAVREDHQKHLMIEVKYTVKCVFA